LTQPNEIFLDLREEKLKKLGFWGEIFQIQIWLTRPEHQKIYPNRLGAKIFDLDPSLIQFKVFIMDIFFDKTKAFILTIFFLSFHIMIKRLEK